MEKAITYVGHSFALILERAVCEMMGIGHGSIVKITFEGSRMIVERTGKLKAAGSNRRPRHGTRMLRTTVTIADPTSPIVTQEVDDDGEYSLEVLARDHRAVATAVVQGLNLDPRAMQQLDPRTPDVYMQAVMRLTGLMSKPNPSAANIIVARRLRYVLDNLERRDEGPRLIALAVARYPWPASSEAMSEGSGADAVTLPPSG